MSSMLFLNDLNESTQSFEDFWNGLKSEEQLLSYNEHESYNLIEKIDHSFEELNQALVTYENIIAINAHIEQYGITEELKNLIGNEGLLQNIGTAFKKVGKFILNIIKRIICYIGEFTLGVGSHFTRMFGILKLNSSVAVPYKISEIEGHAKSILHLNPKYVRSPIDEYKKDIQQYIDKFIELTKDDQKEETKTTYGDLRDSAKVVYNLVIDSRHNLDNIEHCLDKYKTMNENAFDEKQFQELKDAIDKIGFSSQRLIEYVIVAPEQKDKSIVDIVKNQVQYLQAFVTLCTRSMSIGLTFCKKLHAIFTKGAAQINEEFVFPKSIVDHLSKFYGGGVDLKRLIITNLATEEWPDMGATGEILGGWTLGKTKQHDTTIFVAYSAFMKVLKRLSLGLGWSCIDHHGHALTAAEALIRIIVHEAKHLYDEQHGRNMDNPSNYDTETGYRNAGFEKDARKAQRDYEPTKEDIAWAKQIIARLKSVKSGQK